MCTLAQYCNLLHAIQAKWGATDCWIKMYQLFCFVLVFFLSPYSNTAKRNSYSLKKDWMLSLKAFENISKNIFSQKHYCVVPGDFVASGCASMLLWVEFQHPTIILPRVLCRYHLSSTERKTEVHSGRHRLLTKAILSPNRKIGYIQEFQWKNLCFWTILFFHFPLK